MEDQSLTDWQNLRRHSVTKGNDNTSSALLAAVRQHKTLQIVYYGGSRPGETRRITPERVYAVHGTEEYYVDAYCHTRNEVRCFRLDKIEIAEGAGSVPGKGASVSDLEKSILEMLQSSPGLKAKAIAEKLGVDRSAVNACLHGRLKGAVVQNRQYRWYLAQSIGARDNEKEVEAVVLNTNLARLCRYYLDCLNADDLGGVSVFAASKYGNPDYVELSSLPQYADQDPFETEAGRAFLGRLRRDRHRQVMYLGYPVRLKRVRSRRGWEGFFVEPLFLFPYMEPDSQHSRPMLGDDVPSINFSALRTLCNESETGLMQEGIALADELGLTNTPGDVPEMDELFARLETIRPEWDWRERLNPMSLTEGLSLAAIETEGIYNRAVLVAAERSPYTRGLESELGMLQRVEEEHYASTALGSWIAGRPAGPVIDEALPLIEVLPLNSEQRLAVSQAMSNDLTVVTGPPGTGKSQVVASILANAAWRGETVLFASKNNKAVDVVEARVNALGPRPVLLRLGRSEYQAALAQYLVALLASSSTPEDQAQYAECETRHQRVQERLSSIEAMLEETMRLRNEVDATEQCTEDLRMHLGAESFGRIGRLDSGVVRQPASRMVIACRRVARKRQHLLARLMWRFLRGGRHKQLRATAHGFRPISLTLGLAPPEADINAGTEELWVEYGTKLETRLQDMTEAHRYFDLLSALDSAEPLEGLARQRDEALHQEAANSEVMWQTWLRLQHARLSQEQRRVVGDYSSLLQMIVQADDQGNQLSRETFRRYFELFPQITSVLPCWAVTSLSARGRIPFQKEFFDLLVVDEASQCDIASALPLLFRARRVVVIGDPMQLKHISALSTRQDQVLLAKHELVDSNAGWAYSTCSLFDLASSLCRGEDIVNLRDHHRSHADIIGFSNRAFYDSRLRIATRYDRLVFPRGNGPAVRWVDVRGKTIRPGTGGAVNELEARRVVEEVERLVGGGYRGSIGVVSPFRAQANRIRDLVSEKDALSGRLADVGFLADTVHRFQGDERDVMVFSPVVSAGVPDTALGFLRSTPNLFNVAITRARAALLVVGDQTTALGCGVQYLEDFAAYAQHLASAGEGATPVHADLGGPEYPRVSDPSLVSDWERVLYGALYKAGIRPIPQYSVEKYSLDLAVVRGDRRLDIEVDGEHYHRNWDGELCRRDLIRNQRVMELGWDVMRFWVYQVRDDIDTCVARVQRWIDQD